MASPIAPATPSDRAGKSISTPTETTDSAPFGPVLDSQLAAASTPFAPYPTSNTPSAANTGTTADTSQRLERSNPRQGNRRQRK